MTAEEIKRIDEYAEKHTFNAEEIDDITLLILKWMYEQGVLGQE